MPGGDKEPGQSISAEKLIKASGDAIFAVAPDGKILSWNAGAARIGEPSRELTHPPERKRPDKGSGNDAGT